MTVVVGRRAHCSSINRRQRLHRPTTTRQAKIRSIRLPSRVDDRRRYSLCYRYVLHTFGPDSCGAPGYNMIFLRPTCSGCRRPQNVSSTFWSSGPASANHYRGTRRCYQQSSQVGLSQVCNDSSSSSSSSHSNCTTSSLFNRPAILKLFRAEPGHNHTEIAATLHLGCFFYIAQQIESKH